MKKQNKGRKLISLLITIIMLVSFIPFGINVVAADGLPNTDTDIIDSKGHDGRGVPSPFEDGRVWANKIVTDNEDGTFDITLEYNAATFENGRNPLAANTNLVISDKLGPQFTASKPVPSGVMIDELTGKVTWEIAREELKEKEDVTFTVALNAGWSYDVTYYTNEGASAYFTPDGENPYYWTKEEIEDNAFILTGVNWNAGHGINTLTITDNILNVVIGVLGTGNPSPQYLRSWDTSKANSGNWYTIMIDGVSYRWHLYWEEKGDSRNVKAGQSIDGAPIQKTYIITIEGLDDGKDVEYWIDFYNPGGNDSYIPGERVIISTEYFKRNLRPWDGETNNIKDDIHHTGEITITQKILGTDIIVRKNVVNNGTEPTPRETFTFGLYKGDELVKTISITTSHRRSGNFRLTAQEVGELLGGNDSIELTIKEFPRGAADAQWVYDANTYNVTLTKNGVLYKDGDSAAAFTNIYTKHYTVTVEYYVDNVLQGAATQTEGGLENGESYYNSVVGWILERFGKAVFVYGTHNEVDSVATTYEDALEYADRAIDGRDVIIKLYYITNDVNVIVDKTIEFPEDANPADTNFTFTFKLYNAPENGKHVATLTLTNDSFDIREAKEWASSDNALIWEAGVNYYNDLMGKTLYITEVITSDGGSDKWTAGLLPGGRTAYATIDKDNGAVNYLLEDESTIVNKYDKNPQPATVTFEKTFIGDFETFVNQPYDNSSKELVCALDEHEHTDGCFDEDDSEEPICGFDEHEHIDECFDYFYYFNFKLVDKSDNEVDAIAPPLKLSAQEIRERADSGEALKFIFTIPAEKLNDGPFSIVETFGNDYIGWTHDSVSVNVNRLGTAVTYPDGKDKAEMVNEFGGNNIPYFYISKTVLDDRNTDLVKAYDGEFEFELFDGDELIGTYYVTTVDGVGISGKISLPGYINAQYASLTLKEVSGDEEGMTYSAVEYTITIENGVVTSTDNMTFSFSNVYLEKIDPSFRISKSTNSRRFNGTFSFTYSYEFDEALVEDTIQIRTRNGYGSERIPLPANYTGTVTVTENEGETGSEDMGGWVYSSRSYEIEFVKGVRVSGPATAAFTNNYFNPGIELHKQNNQPAEVVATDMLRVLYTLTVTNTGNEAVRDVVVTDDQFNDSVKIFDESGHELAQGTDYDLADGSIKLAGNLNPMDWIRIEYTVEIEAIPEGGSVKNKASVTAVGKDTNISLGDDDETNIKLISQGVDVKITKEVAENSTEPQFEKSVSVNDRDEVIFRITIRATGDYYTPGEIKYRLVDNFFGYDIDKEITLKKNDDYTYGPGYELFSVQVRNYNDEEAATLTNIAYLYSVDSDEPLDENDAEVIVGAYVPGLDVSKKVAEYTGSLFPETGYDWQDSVTFNSSGKKAIFKIVVTNNSVNHATLSLESIKDDFAGNLLTEFYDENGEMVNINDYQELEHDKVITIYYITDALNTRSTFINTVTVIAKDGEYKLEATDSASVTVSWIIRTIDPPITTQIVNDVEPIVTELPEIEIPQVDAPDFPEPEPEPEPVQEPETEPEDVIVVVEADEPEVEAEIDITEPDVPLINLPQTGILSIHSILFVIGAAFAAIGLTVKLFTKKPRREGI